MFANRILLWLIVKILRDRHEVWRIPPLLSFKPLRVFHATLDELRRRALLFLDGQVVECLCVLTTVLLPNHPNHANSTSQFVKAAIISSQRSNRFLQSHIKQDQLVSTHKINYCYHSSFTCHCCVSFSQVTESRKEDWPTTVKSRDEQTSSDNSEKLLLEMIQHSWICQKPVECCSSQPLVGLFFVCCNIHSWNSRCNCPTSRRLYVRTIPPDLAQAAQLENVRRLKHHFQGTRNSCLSTPRSKTLLECSYQSESNMQELHKLELVRT